MGLCFTLALLASNLSKECQETTTWSDISSATLQAGTVGGTTMLLNDMVHRVNGGGVRLQLPGLLQSATLFLSMSTMLMSMYVGAYSAQSEECQDYMWNKMSA